MKKLIAIILTVCMLLSFCACDVLGDIISDSLADSTPDGNVTPSDKNDKEDNKNDDTEKPDNKGEENEGTDPDEGKEETPVGKIYSDFTMTEKNLLTKYIGVLIPFIPNDEYYFEGYYDVDDYENGINFYTVGNTETEFLAYLELYSDYELYETYEDDYGDTWYCYIKDDVVVDLSYYLYEGEYYVDVFVYSDLSGGDEGGDAPIIGYTYTDFTSSEKALFNSYFGFVIPFCPTNEYYVDDLSTTEDGVVTRVLDYYTVGNTEADFNAYCELFASYELSYSYDLDDMVMYVYALGSTELYLSYFLYDGDYYVEVSVVGGSDAGDDSGHTYTDFTDAEKDLLNSYFGFVIPFCPNDLYYLEEYSYDYEDGTTETGINFYAMVDTSSEFDAYRALFSGYTYGGAEVIDGNTWYTYTKGDCTVELSYYEYYDGIYILDLYVFELTEGGAGGGDNNDGAYLYTDFTSSDKALLTSYFGFTIPFLPNNEYVLEEYTYTSGGLTEVGLNFYTFGNTRSEFEAYLLRLSSYTLVDTYDDEYGDTWYCYDITSTVMLDVSYYLIDANVYVVDVYVYEYSESNGGNSGESGGDVETNENVITNAGAGLPNGTSGVHHVDFTKAKNVKDVTDQGYYLDGCPTSGSPAVLVIPVEFSDSLAASKGYTTSALVNAFSKNGVTDYYSVYDYYYISSYGQLTLDITVLDYWFKPQYSSSYYANATYNYYGESVAIGDQLILDEALAYLSGFMDLSAFDSDNNGIIDAVILVNTLDIGEDDFHWAYRYWNVYTDNYGYYYEYDGVSANDYVWASYQFLHETTNARGETVYTDTSAMSTYTFIHEFAHVLGADDYYDTKYVNDPMNGLDIMDSMLGDHNAYTKFNLGWITTSRLVVTSGSVTLTLEAFAKSGDTIIIANNWDDALGAYQEYYVIAYYTGTGLNAGNGGYFLRDGIVVYHVNASLYKEVIDGTTYYDVYNNNTDPSGYNGTEDNLIEYVKSAADTFTYAEGDTLPGVVDDQGNALGYTFVVDSIDGDYATITFTAI